MPEQPLLFDSTALVDIYRGRLTVRPYLDAMIDGKIVGYISVITEAELWRGLHVDEMDRHEALISLFTRLALDSTAARKAGAWMQRYEAHGLGWMDALIAATAWRAQVTVLTRALALARCLEQEVAFQNYL